MKTLQSALQTSPTYLPASSGIPAALTVRTAIQAGKGSRNRCEALASAPALRVRTAIQAGRIALNRCEVIAVA